jgi:hypothetical protein
MKKQDNAQITSEERAEMARMIMDAQLDNLARERSANDAPARLLQVRSSLKKQSDALHNALLNGEPETSLYVGILVERINGLINQELQLTALVGQEGQKAA